jgi:uncharacterized protein (TIGR00255 family)
MNSMTGYGQASAEDAGWRIVVTLRGVNHRYLDVSLRLPEAARGCEADLQRQLGSRMERGRIELGAEIGTPLEPASQIEVDTAAAGALARAADELVATGVASGGLSAADLMNMPEVVRFGGSAVGWGPEAEAVLTEATAAALEQLLEARRQEGARLEAVVVEKIDDLGALVGRLEALRPEVQSALEESFRQRIGELLGDHEVDSERLAQETALLIDRSNVSEELERLRVHLEHFREVAARQGAVGKRLDFLVQEIFRELNTLSAKCRNVEMTRLAVDAKVLCEEMREQLRNVE